MRDLVVAVVEDDCVHATLLEAILARAGWTALVYPSATDFRRRNGTHNVDIALLDWNMPDESGLSLLKSLRLDAVTLPVIFVTSRDQEQEMVKALEAGADDYLVKPVRAGEVVARVRAMMRRFRDAETRVEHFGPFAFELDERVLRLSGGKLRTTALEYDLLLFLFRRAGRIISRETLLAHVWRTTSRVSTRTIDTFVSRLRRIFGLDGRSGWRIDGVYQQGYRLVRVGDTDE